jgi:hypothetical protein
MVDSLISIPKTEFILIGCNQDRCKALGLETQAERNRIRIICEDFSDSRSAEKIGNQIENPGKRLILINNAGLGIYGNFSSIRSEDIHEVIMVNIYALSMLTHRLMPTIIQHGGGVLNISSVAGLVPSPGLGVYGASKAFVTAFSEAIRTELEGHGINVVCYHPAGTESSWFERATRGALKTPSVPQVSAVTVATEALASLAQNRTNPVNGVLNESAARILRAIPRDMAARMVYRRTKKVLSQI